MSSEVFAFIEVKGKAGWVLYKEFAKAHHDPHYNLAPVSWGQYNFSIFYAVSGEKGFPDDLSASLLSVIEDQQAQWGADAINRPSWMWVDDVLSFFQSDKSARYAHFDTQLLESIKKENTARVVFWSV